MSSTAIPSLRPVPASMPSSPVSFVPVPVPLWPSSNVDVHLPPVSLTAHRFPWKRS